MSNSVVRLLATLTVSAFVYVSSEEGSEETFQRFNVRSSDFAEIVNTVSFVDKSMFIKKFIKDQGIVVITAPHRFGKSTNINMLKRFLEIEVDDDGKRKSNITNIREPIRDTDNYDLFVKNKLKIAENESFMDYHFGKHPVISVDLEFDNIHVISYDIAVDHLKYIIHRSYVEHHYLAQSDRLNSEERSIVKRWCSTVGYSKMSESDVGESLRLLSRFLYRHYENRRVYVLIDNFDSPVLNALLFALTEDIMGGIYRLISNVIIKVLQKNFHAHRGLISGTSYVTGSPALYSLGYVSVCRFLENHKYTGFHGLTEAEVGELFSKETFNLNEEKVKQANAMYGGFQSCCNVTLYNPWSVIHFLLAGEVRSYWKDPGVIFKIENLLKVPTLRKEISLLARGEKRKVRLKKIYAPDDVIRLHDLILRPELHLELHNVDVVLTFLLELGYLTYVPDVQTFLGRKLVRVPNKEIRVEFCEKLKKYEKNYGPIKHR